MRIFLEYILPILAPTALWVLWLVWRQHRSRALGLPAPDWNSVPITWLLIAGGVLALLLTVGGSLVSGYATGAYQPARIDTQGHLVPGQVK